MAETTFFAIVPEWVLRQASPSAVKLYGLLDRYAGRGGTCWPSRDTLAESLGCSTRTVNRLVRELEALQALVIQPRFREDGSQTSNGFYLRRETPVSGGGDTNGKGGGDISVTPMNESQIEEDQNLKTVVEVPKSRTSTADVQAVYDHWRKVCNKGRANYDRITPARRKKIQKRLTEFSVSELCSALDGVARDPWSERHLHDDLVKVFRSQEQVERFLEMPSKSTNGHLKVTGWRMVRGSHGVTHVPDDLGTDQPPRNWA